MPARWGEQRLVEVRLLRAPWASACELLEALVEVAGRLSILALPSGELPRKAFLPQAPDPRDPGERFRDCPGPDRMRCIRVRLMFTSPRMDEATSTEERNEPGRVPGCGLVEGRIGLVDVV